MEATQTSEKIPENGEKRRTGRPPKKNAETVARLLEIARSGLPLRFACAAVGITKQGLALWRERDREFAQALEQARLESVEHRWNQIVQAGIGTEERPGDWRSLAWSLERTYPEEFARPEVQLNVQNNTQVNVGGEFVINVEGAKVIENRTRELEVEIEQMFEARQLQK